MTSIAAIILAASAAASLPAQAAADPATASATASATESAARPAEVRGTFDIAMTPGAQGTPDDPRGRMTFRKTFHGPLSGTGDGEMLTAGSPATGSAGYVALERFAGTLDGRRGSFVMQHSGTMHGGKQKLDIVIAPGSGTGELAGIAGSATIDIKGGQHYYTLRYALPAR